jgi:ribosomal protein S18 acetylase RimI-like enzyme
MSRLFPLRIVRAESTDVETLTPLFEQWRQFYKQAANAGEAASFLRERISRRECEIYIARNNESAALGYILIYPMFSSLMMSRVVVLNDMFVAEHARRRGVGRALLERARSYAQNIGAARIDVSLKPENEAALALYESLGYVRDGFFHLSRTL